MTKKNLILFTSSFPYGKGEYFLETEIEFLSKEFIEIEIYPFYYGNVITKRNVPKNVIVHKPVIPISKQKRFLLFFKSVLLFAPVFILIVDFFKNKAYKNKSTIKRWLITFIDFSILTKSNQYKNIQHKKNTIFYFFWGTGWALSLNTLRKHKTNTYFVRLHGSDVYLERSNGYIPLRMKLFKNTQKIISISENIISYLTNTYKVNKNKIILSRLGTKYVSKNPGADIKDKLHIVSCSNIIALKRVHLIIDILSRIQDTEIIWTHFGDGPLLNDIIRKSKKLQKNIEVNFLGRKPNKYILEFYKNNHIDLFINVSMYEGVPVSIMEALSFGIPVIATNAGATKEIVNNQNGKLLPINFNLQDVANIIRNVRNEYWIKKRIMAFEFWNKNYNAETNYTELSKILKE